MNKIGHMHYCGACGVVFEEDSLSNECPCCGNRYDGSDGIRIETIEQDETEHRELTNAEKLHIKHTLKHDIVMYDGANDLWKFKGSRLVRVFYAGKDCLRVNVLDFGTPCIITDGRVYMPWSYRYEDYDGAYIATEPLEWKGKDGTTGHRECYRMET